MEEWISLIIEYAATGVEICALIVILHGAARTLYIYLREGIARHCESCVSDLNCDCRLPATWPLGWSSRWLAISYTRSSLPRGKSWGCWQASPRCGRS